MFEGVASGISDRSVLLPGAARSGHRNESKADVSPMPTETATNKDSRIKRVDK